MTINVSTYIEQKREQGDDDFIVRHKNQSIFFCVADGAGGMSGGQEASHAVTQSIRESNILDTLNTPDDFELFLRNLDTSLYLNPEAGETTVVFGVIRKGLIVGASVGDSEAWLFAPDVDYELTSLQYKKSLLGSNEAIPVGFGPVDFCSVLLVGSDGLFKYASHQKLKALLVSPSTSAKEIASLAKVHTGTLQDDISLIHFNIFAKASHKQ